MDKSTFQKVLRRAILLPLALAAVLAVTLILEVQSFVYRAGWVEHTDQVIDVSDRIYRIRIDQETGLRAYQLTNDERFLQPYREGQDQAPKLEDELRRLISDNPEQQARNEKAIQAHQQWQSFADRVLAMERGGEDVGDVKLQLHGKELMDQYRDARTAFTVREEQLRDQGEARSRRTLRFVNVSVVALCLLLGVIISVGGRRQLVNLSGAFSTALDIAQANAAEAQAQKKWSHTILHSIGDAVIATDADGAISFMNPVAERLTGWTIQEAQRKALTEVFRIVNEQTHETVENPVEKVRRLNRVVGLANHTVLISKSGQEFAIDDSGSPITDASGAMAGIVLIFRDVTQQRGLEAAMRSNERLAVAGRLSASIAHEIHNPLDTAGNLLFMANEQTNDRPQLQRLISAAQREVHRVAQISKNMLSLHRESRTLSSIKLSELLDGVVALIEETIAKGKRNLQVEHGFEGEIEGLPAELRQVFTNVLKNAVEATSEGGSIRIFSAPSQERNQPGVLVQVADNGVGIPEQIKSKLFTPFATSKEESGSGLGLWVSRAIVEKHQGSIRVSSTESGYLGTTVSIFLPLKGRVRMSADDAASGRASTQANTEHAHH
jgi:PAS domain S-box-containing protein